MKQLLLVGLASGALAGCMSAEYPATLNDTPSRPVTPQYPITKASLQTAEAPAPVTTPQAAPAASPPAANPPTSPPVDSAPLPPGPYAPAPAAPPSAPADSPPPAYSPPPTYAPPARRAETRVVAGGKVVAARGMYRSYEVQSGDHLDAIARDLNTTRGELIEANHLKSPFRIHPGEHIKVPVAKAYVVESGDTLSAIAHRFGVGLGELAGLNDLPERGRVSAGMYVALPASFEDHGPSRETVTEAVATASRTHAAYRMELPKPSYGSSSSHTPGAPYTPSPEALAAAAARHEETLHPASPAPTYQASRVGTKRPNPEEPLNTGAIVAAGQGKFIWPVKGDILAPFGATGAGRRNDGVDIARALRAARCGPRRWARWSMPATRFQGFSATWC